MRRDWNFWLDLPTTPKDFSRIDDLDEKIGALETLLLDKQQLRLDGLRRRRLHGLRREDRHPPLHRHRDRPDAAARGEAVAELDDLINRAWRSTSGSSWRPAGGPHRHRAVPRWWMPPTTQGPHPGDLAAKLDQGRQGLAAARSGLAQVG
jgi:hypothetical protein